MNEERHSDRPGEREIERDSQLSAMFDGELPAGECELIARRLSRDEALRSQWSRFSMIGAAIRAERGVALHDRVAWRVQSVVSQEPVYGDGSDITGTHTRTAAVVPAEVLRRETPRGGWMRFTRPLAGAGIAASVAAAAILFVRFQGGEDVQLAANTAVPVINSPQQPVVSPAVVARNEESRSASAAGGEPEGYSTPLPNNSNSLAPSASLANYVVAHSEVSGPISRRMALMGLLASEQQGAAAAQPEGDAAAEANDAP